MVVIRLSRGGTKKRPFYYITAADRRRSRDGKYLERLGYYNPIATGGETRLRIDQARVDHWLNLGAQPTERVQHLLQTNSNPELAAKKTAAKRAKVEKKKAAKKAEAAASETAATTEESTESN